MRRWLLHPTWWSTFLASKNCASLGQRKMFELEGREKLETSLCQLFIRDHIFVLPKGGREHTPLFQVFIRPPWLQDLWGDTQNSSTTDGPWYWYCRSLKVCKMMGSIVDVGDFFEIGIFQSNFGVSFAVGIGQSDELANRSKIWRNVTGCGNYNWTVFFVILPIMGPRHYKLTDKAHPKPLILKLNCETTKLRAIPIWKPKVLCTCVETACCASSQFSWLSDPC